MCIAGRLITSSPRGRRSGGGGGRDDICLGAHVTTKSSLSPPPPPPPIYTPTGAMVIVRLSAFPNLRRVFIKGLVIFYF